MYFTSLRSCLSFLPSFGLAFEWSKVLSPVCYKGLLFLRFTQKEHPQTAAKQFGTTLL